MAEIHQSCGASGGPVPPLAVAAHDNSANPPTQLVVPAILMAARAAASLCGVSLRTWRRWDASGAMPAAISVGLGSKRWRREELEAWAAAGCPMREQWNQIRNNEDAIGIGAGARRRKG